jgi:hypothetical protein
MFLHSEQLLHRRSALNSAEIRRTFNSDQLFEISSLILTIHKDLATERIL